MRIKTSTNVCINFRPLGKKYKYQSNTNTNTASYLVLPTTINLLDGFHSKQFMPYNPPMYLPSPIVNPAGGAAT